MSYDTSTLDTLFDDDGWDTVSRHKDAATVYDYED